MNQKNFEAPVKKPLLPVRDIVIFPSMIIPLSIGREKSIKALESAMAADRIIFIATQKKVQMEDPQKDDLYEIGIIGELLQMIKTTDGTLKVLIEGIKRARLLEYTYITDKGYVEVTAQPLAEEQLAGHEIEAMRREVTDLFEQYVKFNQRLPIDIAPAIKNIEDTGKLCDTISSHLVIKIQEKLSLLEITAVRKRLEKLIEILNREIDILNIERKIQTRVRTQIEKTQKEYYLTEQMKAIQKELRQKDDFAKEIDEVRQKIKQAKMSKEAQEVADKELMRLEKMMPFSPEATVIRTYLDWLITLPWSATTPDNFDIKRAEKILDEDHYGLQKVKERVLEYLAVLSRVKKIKGPILCFVGPPGVGKTSIAKSVARALGRNFVRASLGGVRDEAEIRGHRRTYIGSLPGRILQWMRKAKFKNPVFLLDEIDKMGSDWRGDPSAALLEVLDPEQNFSFVDHYMDVEFDLSSVMFITTANTLFSIPPSLVDRLEILRFPGYTIDEKIKIAEKYLIPKQLKEHGFIKEVKETKNGGHNAESKNNKNSDHNAESKNNKNGGPNGTTVSFTKDSIEEIIRNYTREAGVRNLDREIANVCRKAAKELAMDEKKKTIAITKKNTGKYLGIPEFLREKVSPNDVGVSTGLAWTEHGGETLTIEVMMMNGKGKYILTGKLGEVMQESAQAAMSYIRSISHKYKVKNDFFKNKDFHIHIPEGAIPKDGPSAGIAMATALASAVSNRPVKKDIAMTGEITLRGRVLPIGGLKEKLIAAYGENIKTVIFPESNRKDLKEIPQKIQKSIKLVTVKHMDDVLKIALG